MKKLFILFPILCFISSCSTRDTTGTPETIDNNPEMGMAIGTITFEGDRPVNDIYRFFYEPTKGDKKFIRKNKGKIEIKARVNNESAYNGDFNNSKTYLFVIQQLPGEYAFTQYNYLDRIGYTGMVYNSDEFSLPFTIQKNKVHYIGEFTYSENAAPGSPRLFIWDKFDRDRKEFLEKYSKYNWDNITNKTISKGDDGGGIISFME